LSTSGAVAGSIVGAVVLYGAGWEGGAVLAAFFVSSTLVSRIGPPPPPSPLDLKSDRRDAWQVFANGGPAALAAAILPATGVELWAITASLAAAAADTWATSVGAHSRVSPRLLWSGRRVAPGSSGGVTVLGSAGALLGGAVVAGTGAVVSRELTLFTLGTLIGFVGMLADSVSGGALQGRFHCPRCDQPSERHFHRCGSATEWKGGLAWLTNDGVNLVATTLAACLGWFAWNWRD
jgi:uncharacterized protein (TIGR00297 family)